MAIVTVKNKYQVVIPQVLRRQIGVNVGDLMDAQVKKGKIIFAPKTLLDRDLLDSVAESMAEYKAGKFYGPFDNHKDFIASLHREAKKLKKARKQK